MSKVVAVKSYHFFSSVCFAKISSILKTSRRNAFMLELVFAVHATHKLRRLPQRYGVLGNFKKVILQDTMRRMSAVGSYVLIVRSAKYSSEN